MLVRIGRSDVCGREREQIYVSLLSAIVTAVIIMEGGSDSDLLVLDQSAALGENREEGGERKEEEEKAGEKEGKKEGKDSNLLKLISLAKICRSYTVQCFHK